MTVTKGDDDGQIDKQQSDHHTICFVNIFFFFRVMVYFLIVVLVFLRFLQKGKRQWENGSKIILVFSLFVVEILNVLKMNFKNVTMIYLSSSSKLVYPPFKGTILHFLIIIKDLSKNDSNQFGVKLKNQWFDPLECCI